MNKPELVRNVSEKSNLKNIEAQVVVDAVFDTIQETLANNEKVQIIGFGTFEVRERAERNGRNPATGEAIMIPSASVPVFKPGKSFKDAVNSVTHQQYY